jgi:hypothetical protein
MAICKTCGSKHSKWTTPFSAKGVCRDCFEPEPGHEPEAGTEELASSPENVLAAKPSVRIRFTSFLPRSRSKVVFVLVMVSYTLSAATLLRAIATACGAERAPLSALLKRGYPGLEVITLVLLAPVIESLILIGMIELLRWLRSPVWLQLTLAASISAIAELPISKAVVIAPGWFIMAAAYLMWRRVSWKVGFAMIASIHALLNLSAAIWAIGYAIHHHANP